MNLPPLHPGKHWPLGATWDGKGINFAVFSAHATQIDLCLFDASGAVEIARLPLAAHTQGVWHGYLPAAAHPAIQPGLLYGLRAHGAWEPERGHRFNPHKLLLDPYAREVVGDFAWDRVHFGFLQDAPTQIDTHDNASSALKARVLAKDGDFDWGSDHPPHVPLVDTVLYELHVKGFSQLNPAVPAALQGTYAGLAHPASLTHLKNLGVTTLSLLPVHYALDEERLVHMGLSNYWGYNTLAFFAPSGELASGADGHSPRDEFRAMVKAIHAQGLEVVLDVVFNHTAETDEHGPHLSFRGLDNASYYRLQDGNRAHYENHSGCGNTLDIRQPRVLQLVMDSLRYWVDSMHVDGFRFDLAPVLSRGDHGFEPGGAFFKAVAQDPVLSRVKLIAEPWDIGPGGYQVGGFPPGWMEWNDRFRDTMRSYWLRSGHPPKSRGDFALRLCGSSDLYQHRQLRQRPPGESVNYVVSHDGFTLHDLVSYQERHNHANGENNADGHGDNLSTNCGTEGATADAAINSLRGRMKRALIATTLLAQGTPMLCAGDELGHTQNGNNNPYCQDNATTWIDWAQADRDLIVFTAHVVYLRKQFHPLAETWYSGLPNNSGLPDIAWLNRNGRPMQPSDWNDTQDNSLACLIHQTGGNTNPLLLLVNPQDTGIEFALPAGAWRVLLDTASPTGTVSQANYPSLTHWVQGHSVVLLNGSAVP